MTRDEVIIAPFQTGDELLIPSLVREVYGDGYDSRFYGAESIAEMVHDGLLLILAKEKGSGRLLGMTGFATEAANPCLWRTFRRMVSPSARGCGIASLCEAEGERLLVEGGKADGFYAQLDVKSPSNPMLAKHGFSLTAVLPAFLGRSAQTFWFKLTGCDGGSREAEAESRQSIHAIFRVSTDLGTRRLFFQSGGANLFAQLAVWAPDSAVTELILSSPTDEDLAYLKSNGWTPCGVLPLWGFSPARLYLKFRGETHMPPTPEWANGAAELWNSLSGLSTPDGV